MQHRVIKSIIPLKSIILTIFIVLNSCERVEKPDSQKPNIVIILVDDLGYGDLGYYNPNSLIPTPNLDKLASQGISLTNAYCPIAVCSPSRYALMTGTYPWRSWNKSGVMSNYQPSMIAEGQLTLPEMLQEVGYVTAGFGKWHLGTSFPTLDGKKPSGYGMFHADDNGANLDLTKDVYDGPIDHGFNHWLGFSCASECWIFKDKKVVAALQHDYYTIEAASNTENLQLIPMDEYLPFLTKKTLNFLKGHKADEKPFLLYFAPYVPHTPLAPSEGFIGTTEAGVYGDFVSQLDTAIGEILNSLNTLGLDENTIVLFASDNGSAIQVTYKGMEDSDDLNRLGGHPINVKEYPLRDSVQANGKVVHHPNGVLKGTKQTAWEGGVKTPLIVRWPGNFPAGVKSSELFALNDIMPTLAEIVDYKIPNNMAVDGLSLYAVLKGQKGKRESLAVQSSNNVFGLRRGKWKYINGETHPDRKNSLPVYELYDLSIDPSEANNVIDDFPEVAKSMKKELDKLTTTNK